MSSVIYCISGLGAGEKVFSRLKFKNHNLVHLPWIQPLKQEKIAAYSRRMAEKIRDPSPIILGVSFGGMVAIEMAKQIPVKKVCIVSSVKSSNEIPFWMRAGGYFHVNKIIPLKPFRIFEPITNHRLGVSNIDERDMVRAYRRDVDPYYLRWAVDKVINWKNQWQPEQLLHIHGDQDKIFPLKNIATAKVIRGGSHMMIYNRADEIGDIIEQSFA